MNFQERPYNAVKRGSVELATRSSSSRTDGKIVLELRAQMDAGSSRVKATLIKPPIQKRFLDTRHAWGSYCRKCIAAPYAHAKLAQKLPGSVLKLP